MLNSILQQKAKQIDGALYSQLCENAVDAAVRLRIALVSEAEVFKPDPSHIKHFLDQIYDEYLEFTNFK